MTPKRRKPGVWCIDAFSDASGAWVTHWRRDGTHACYCDDGSEASFGADCRYDPTDDARIPRRLARLLIRRWRQVAADSARRALDSRQET